MSGFPYRPPTIIGAAFNSSNFASTQNEVGFNIAEADTRYLRLIEAGPITGITAGQALGNKALVLNGSRNITNINQIETTGRFFMRTTGFGFTQEHGPNDADGEIITKVGATFGEIGAFRSVDFGIITGDQRRLTVKNSGFVGIGTANPTTLLDINGNCRVSGTFLAESSQSSPAHTFTGLGDTKLNIIGIGGAPFPELNLICQHSTGGSASWGVDSLTDWKFQVVGSGLRIRSGENNTSAIRMAISTNGNVGLGGITSPTTALDVGGVIRSSNSLEVLRTTTGDAFKSTNGTSICAMNHINNGDVEFGSTSNHNLALRTNNTSRILIRENGNVGIGVNPAEKLDVGGTINATEYKLSGSSLNFGVLSGLTATTAELNSLDITTVGTAEANKALVLDGSRNITNLNEVSSTGKYLITAGGFSGFIHRAGSGPTDAITLTEPGGIGTNNSTNFHLFTNSSRRLTVLADGKVGINTQSPTELLHVGGKILCNNLDVSGPNMSIFSGADTNFTIRSTVSSTSYYPTIDFVRGPSYGSDNVVDWRMRCFGQDFVYYCSDNSIGNTEIMRMTSVGNMGIGITNPVATLHVGAGRASNIGVSQLYAEYGSTFSSTSQNAQPTGISRNISVRATDGFLTNSSYFAQSDRRTKKNIVNLDHQEALHFVKSIEPVKYHLNVEDDKQHKHFGYIAQDLKEYIDLLNFTERENFPKQSEDDLENVALSVDYSKICVLLHKVLKSVVADLDSLYESGSYAEWRRRKTQA